MSARRDLLIWALVFAGLTALTQFGSIRREIINWDENTFMLLGAGLLDGTLPFVALFDNKPPMIFFLFAGWMGLFGETVPSVRLFGDVCLWATACTIFVIARRYASTGGAGLAGMLYIAMHGVEPGLHTTAGLPAMLCVMIALWLILRWREAAWALLLAGMLVSIAVLTRSNLAYVALTSGIALFALGLWRPEASRCTWKTALWYGLGGMIPLALMIGLYARVGAVEELKLASVDVALSYSGQWSLPGAALGNLRKWVEAMASTPLVHVPFTLLTCAAIVASLRPGQGSKQGLTRADWAIIWVFLLATLFSILKSGAVYTYYWQQFFPLTCLFVPPLVDRLRAPSLRLGAAALVGLAVIGALLPNAADSLRVLTAPGRVTENYDTAKAAAFLRPRLKDGDRIWALDRHLILLYLDAPVISPILAHPSNITRSAILAPLEDRRYLLNGELQRVMDSKPDYLVSNGHDDLFYFRIRSSVDIKAYMRENYDLIFETPQVTIWQRKDLT